MINLIQTGIDVEKAKQEHLNYFSCYVYKRLYNHPCHDGCTVCEQIPSRRRKNSSSHLNDFQLLIRWIGIKNILVGSPHQLKCFSNLFKEFINKKYGTGAYYKFYYNKQKNTISNLTDLEHLATEIKLIFNYNHFKELEPADIYGSYQLANLLNVRSCTYCNRVYTTTRSSNSKGKLMIHQFDHWYPKVYHPLLAISFYNLIPSCNSCNGPVKGSINLDLDIHTHPYVSDDKRDDLLFDYEHFKKIDKYNIFLKEINPKHKKSLTTAQVLKIDQMYNAHTAELEDLLLTAKEYSIDYLEILQKSFPGANLSKQEVYRLAFGVELESKDFYKKPMSKFKHDILKEIGILKED